MAENIDIFNEMVGLIFDQLYRAFPEPRPIDLTTLAGGLRIGWTDVEKEKETLASLGARLNAQRAQAPETLTVIKREFDALPDAGGFEARVSHTVSWLEDEGFVRLAAKYPKRYVLTSKTLLALNAIPAGLKKPLGAKLGEVLKGFGTEAGRAAISQAVSQIFGEASRPFVG